MFHGAVLQPPWARPRVWPLPLSLATTCGITTCFLFLRLLRCFSSAGSRLLSSRLQREGLPHSDICGSKVVCTSPQLFAAYHVLRRLREPRHPPYALISLPSHHLFAPNRHEQVVLPEILLQTLLFYGSMFVNKPFLSSLIISTLPSLVNELFISITNCRS
jgi:hypothetical protein